MRRIITRGGEATSYDEIDEAVAIRTADAPERADDHAPENDLAAVKGAAAAGLAEDQAAFASAGWRIADRAEEATRAAAPGRRARPLIGPDGRLSLLDDGLVVQLAPDLTEDQARATLATEGLAVERVLGFAPNLFETRVMDGGDPLDRAERLSRRSDVLAAEPNLVERVPERAFDPLYPRQWQWRNDGADGGIAGADLNVEVAWSQTRGAGVRIAVIDTGFDVAHPDLRGALADGAGAFLSDGRFSARPADIPVRGHGTFCAAQAAGRRGNGEGGCGAAPEASLMLVSVLPDQVGTQSTLARAVAYAARPQSEGVPVDGADVIVCSLGPDGPLWAISIGLRLAIDFAARKGRDGAGCPVFWAVSNGTYPIAGDKVASHPSVIAVGRSTHEDREHGSAFGAELDFLAPGVDVLNAWTDGGYRVDTGTSYAAPATAGVAALVLAIRPDLSAAGLRNLMRAACRKVGGVGYGGDGRHPRYGYGRIDAGASVAAAENRSV
jgi:thermitase